MVGLVKVDQWSWWMHIWITICVPTVQFGKVNCLVFFLNGVWTLKVQVQRSAIRFAMAINGEKWSVFFFANSPYPDILIACMGPNWKMESPAVSTYNLVAHLIKTQWKWDPSTKIVATIGKSRDPWMKCLTIIRWVGSLLNSGGSNHFQQWEGVGCEAQVWNVRIRSP